MIVGLWVFEGFSIIINFSLLYSISQELQIISSGFLVHWCKRMVFQVFFFNFFLKYNVLHIKILLLFYWPISTDFLINSCFYVWIFVYSVIFYYINIITKIYLIWCVVWNNELSCSTPFNTLFCHSNRL